MAKHPWGVVSFDPQTGHVSVREDWLYRWCRWPGATPKWASVEKIAAHKSIERSIWRTASNRLALKVRARTGSQPAFGPLAPVSFDVRQVNRGGHWSIFVWKMPAAGGALAQHYPFISPERRVIEINSTELGASRRAETAGCGFAPVADNGGEPGSADRVLNESYNLGSIRTEVRNRHLELVAAALNALVPDLEFQV